MITLEDINRKQETIDSLYNELRTILLYENELKYKDVLKTLRDKYLDKSVVISQQLGFKINSKCWIKRVLDIKIENDRLEFFGNDVINVAEYETNKPFITYNGTAMDSCELSIEDVSDILEFSNNVVNIIDSDFKNNFINSLINKAKEYERC